MELQVNDFLKITTVDEMVTALEKILAEKERLAGAYDDEGLENDEDALADVQNFIGGKLAYAPLLEKIAEEKRGTDVGALAHWLRRMG